MSGAEKSAEWSGNTATHGFSADVFFDREQGLYIANLQTYTPAFAQAIAPGGQVPMMNFDPMEKIQHHDHDVLLGLTKKRITDRCGKILHFEPR